MQNTAVAARATFKRVLAIYFLCTLYLQGNAEEPRPLRIAFLTDIHVSPGAVGEANLERTVEEINAGHYDFTVVTGDLTNTGLDTELVTVHRILSKLNTPLHIVPGNHETNWSESACQTFIQLWGNDRFVFESGPFVFIGFNTGPFMKMGDGHVKAEDVRWIDHTLRQYAKPGKIVISLSHYPLGDGLDNWYDITDILKRYNTRLVLCGHGHHLSRHNFDGLPGIMGRSAIIAGSDTAGYNILTLTPDSAIVCQKKLGVEASAPFVAFALKDPSPVLNGHGSIARADTVARLPWAAPVVAVKLKDTASIYTGILPIDKNTIVYGTSAGDVVSRDPVTGKYKWRNHYTGSIYSTPVYGRGIIAFSTVDGVIHGLDQRTGKEKWALRTGQPGISEGLLKDELLYIGTGSKFYCIRLTNGQQVWASTDPEGQLQARPILSPDNRSVLFGVWDRHLYCLDAATGSTRWKWDNGKQQKLYSPGNTVPAVVGSTVYLVAPDRYMTAIDLTSGATLWRDNSRHVRESMGVSADGKRIYAKLMNDSIIAVAADPSSFHTVWESNARFGYEHNPCPILENNGVVYAGTRNGIFIAADALTGKVLREDKPGNSSINEITADKDGNIWVSLIEGSIIQYKTINQSN